MQSIGNPSDSLCLFLTDHEQQDRVIALQREFAGLTQSSPQNTTELFGTASAYGQRIYQQLIEEYDRDGQVAVERFLNRCEGQLRRVKREETSARTSLTMRAG